MGFSQRFRFAHFLHRRLNIDGPLVDALADRFEIDCWSTGSYWKDWRRLSTTSSRALVGERVAQQLHEILRQRQEMTHTALEALRTQYPGYANLLERRLLDKVALRRQDQEYRAFVRLGRHRAGTLRSAAP